MSAKLDFRGSSHTSNNNNNNKTHTYSRIVDDSVKCRPSVFHLRRGMLHGFIRRGIQNDQLQAILTTIGTDRMDNVLNRRLTTFWISRSKVHDSICPFRDQSLTNRLANAFVTTRDEDAFHGGGQRGVGGVYRHCENQQPPQREEL